MHARRFAIKWITPAVILSIAGLGAILSLSAPNTFARIAFNTIDHTAIGGANGRHIIITGPLATDQSQPVSMRVTLTQRSTGAIAEGITNFIGTTEQQQWTVHARTIGPPTFEPGPAVALARSKIIPGGADDAQQWLVMMSLVK